MSPFHFQRLFKEWVRVSPKKYLQYLSLDYAKQRLKESKATLLDTAIDVGLSGTSRLHDLFINIEGMTPGAYKNGGEHLSILYSLRATLFGDVFIASTLKGVCFLSFTDGIDDGLKDLKQLFPKADIQEGRDSFQDNACLLFKNDQTDLKQIKLHLKGTEFQLKVWEALLTIPQGNLATYSDIAHGIKNPKAVRAVGTAIGRNPIAFIIPCHRVIQSTGKLGGYRWNPTRKKIIIGWEQSKRE